MRIISEVYQGGTKFPSQRNSQPLTHLVRLGNFALIYALDLLERMLEFDPRSRLSAKQCLEHEYLTRFHDPTEESEANEKFDWSFNQADLSADAWNYSERANLYVTMYSEILDFHRIRALDAGALSVYIQF